MKIDIKKLAELSQLDLAEVEGLNFDSMLNFVEQISKIDVGNMLANLKTIKLADLREDNVKQGLTQDSVLASAPETADGGFAVPKMME